MEDLINTLSTSQLTHPLGIGLGPKMGRFMALSQADLGNSNLSPGNKSVSDFIVNMHLVTRYIKGQLGKSKIYRNTLLYF